MTRDSIPDEFKNKPKYRGLPMSVIRERYKQRLESLGGLAQIRENRTRNRRRARGAPRETIDGRGNYFTNALGRGAHAAHRWAQRNIPAGSLSALGTAAGGAMAKAPGATIGGMLGSKLAQLVGFGDYKIRRNSLLSPDAARAASNGSTFSHSRTNSVVISKRENIGKIVGTTASSNGFELMQFRIQPTDPATFPWLHSVAANFVEYDLLGMIVSFETTSSAYAPSVGLGCVGIATQYNANALPFTDMEALLNAQGASSGNPAEDIVHGVECDPQERIRHGAGEILYTRRPGTRGAVNLYDFGVLNVGVEGIPAAAVGAELGKLYVTYQIELDITALPVSPPGSHQLLEVGAYEWHIQSDTPPFGKTLNLVAAHNNDYPQNMSTAGQTTTDVLRLFSPGPPITFQSISNEVQMAYWMNDSTLDTMSQYLGFTSAGVYDLSCILAHQYQVDHSVKIEAVDTNQGEPIVWHYADWHTTHGFTHSDRYVVKTTNAGQQVKLSWHPTDPSGSTMHLSLLTIIPRHDMSFPHLSHTAPSIQPPSQTEIEELPTDKGKWVETRVFVPEDDKIVI
jgi:hypothetical protein